MKDVTLVLSVVCNELVYVRELNLVTDKHLARLRLGTNTEVFDHRGSLLVVLSAHRQRQGAGPSLAFAHQERSWLGCLEVRFTDAALDQTEIPAEKQSDHSPRLVE